MAEPNDEDDEDFFKGLTEKQRREYDERITYSDPNQVQFIGPDGKECTAEELLAELKKPAPVTTHLHLPQENEDE